MCYNCGCHIPQDSMGSDDNITDATLNKLADHWGKSLQETKLALIELLKNNQVEKDPYVSDLFIKAGKSWGQSEDEAKKNTLSLLNSTL